MIFKQISLHDLDTVLKYTQKYGGGTCQYGIANLISQQEKYGDSFFEEDGILYIFRKNFKEPGYRTYLAPLGDGDRKMAFQKILDDAHVHGSKVQFHTVTEDVKNEIETWFPGLFSAQELSDYGEYIYLTESMQTFDGSELKNRRREINRFWNHYSEYTEITPLSSADLDEVLAFENKWLTNLTDKYDRRNLVREARMIRYHLEHFEQLSLCGLVLRIEGKICGFAYGTRLNDQYYDAIIEKADHSFPGIHKVLRQESARQCANGTTYFNVEEDLGIIGLRKMKTLYHPAFILKKYLVKEI